MNYKTQMLRTVCACIFSLGLVTPVMAVTSLQIGDADGGVCDSYNLTTEDCMVGGSFSVTSLEAGAGYIVFSAVPMTNSDTFIIDPSGDGGFLALVESGFGTPPFEDENSLAPHGIFDTYFEVYRLDFDTAGTVFNTQPGNPGDSAPGYVEFIDMNLSSLTDGLHIDLFRCSTGSVEDGDCMISKGFDSAPFSHDATFVPVPAAVWLFGSGLLGLVAVSRRKVR
jgi:hypothetical protein